MKNRLGISINKLLWVLLIFIACISVVQAAETTALTFSPETSAIDLGQTTEYTVTADSFPNGIAGYNITVELSDSSVAEIQNVTFPSWTTINSNGDLPSGSIWIKGVDLDQEIQAGAADTELFTIVVKGKKAGSSDINLEVNQIDADDGGVVQADPGEAEITIKAPIPGDVEWSAEIHATNELESVKVGMNPSASADYNSAFDKYTLNPIQSMVIMNLDEVYATKIKTSVFPGENITWDLSVTVPDSSSSVLTWNERPDSQVEVKIFDDSIELTSGAVLEVGHHALIVKAYVSDKATYSLHLNPGWNMISLPITPDNSSVYSIFEGLTTLSVRPVVTWKNNMFTEVGELEPGAGYWAFSPKSLDFEITGTPIDELSFTLSAGWNMIGTAGTENLELSSIPNQVSARPAVTWSNNMFTTVTSLEAGSGAWAFVIKTTEVTL